MGRAAAYLGFSGLLLLCASFQAATCSDWPTYRADAARSGYTPDELPEALSLRWSFEPAHRPMPAWPHSERMTFDRAFQPVVGGSLLYFGSSADGGVYALDAATGNVRWTYWTGGPVRFAPVVWRDRVFVASDDGWLVCLAAADGKLLWRRRGGPRPDMLLGNDRMISRWPARGGPVLADGVLYFGAGIWPTEGIFLYALDPATGDVRWCNDSSGSIEMDQPHSTARARSGVAAQGYLAVAGDRLLVATGRAVPAVFGRRDGEFLSFPLQTFGRMGGADVVAFDGCHFSQGTVFPPEAEIKPQAVGAQLAVHPRYVVSCSGTTLSVRDRARLWITSGTIDRKGKEARKKTFAPASWTLQLPHEGDASLILAGSKAVLGGKDRVMVVDLDSRRLAWTGEVNGVARGLAAAGGRLYVSTENGVLCCFGQGPLDQPPRWAAVRLEDPRPSGPTFSGAAEEILRRSGKRQGYCLDLGCGDGELTLELARRSKLQILAVDPDAARIENLRRLLVAAGWYGTRVSVLQSPLDGVPFARWFADLVVSGRSVLEGEGAVPEVSVDRFQRPWGGVACLGKPGAMKVSVRGALEGEGAWTHQYADAANSLCSGDVRLRGPLAMLWYRDTDLVFPNRHGRGPAPLVHHGRMYVEGLDALRAVSIYNGRTLWEIPLPGILAPYHQEHLMGVAGTGSNVCLGGERIFVAVKDRCLCLDASDGSKLAEFAAPPRPDGKPGIWGYLACQGSTLFGTLANDQHLVKFRFKASDMSRLYTESDLLFAMDAATGKVKWIYKPRHSLRHNAIAIGCGHIYLIDRPVALVDRIDPVYKGRREHEAGLLCALDAETGQVRWKVEGAFGTLLALSTPHDVLLMSYQSTRFQLDSERGGRMAAFRASDGTRLWDVAAKYLSRPILNGRTIYAQPGAWDLLSGQALPFEFQRSYGCGILAGSARMLVYRSATMAYLDLAGSRKTENYGGIRPGCWINAIPAGGLVLLAEAASWCTCSYLNQGTVALQPPEDAPPSLTP